MSINTIGKIAIGAGIVAGMGVLAACGASEKDAQGVVLDEFQKFDRGPRDNTWSREESRLHTVGRPYTRHRHELYRIGDYVTWQQQVVHNESTYAMDKAWAAASGNDGLASLRELTQLATSFDRDGNGTLNRKERRAFDKAYGVDTHTRVILDRVETGVSYSPRRHYPDADDRHTSDGDTGYPSGGGYRPPTGGGDTGGYRPPTSGGDTGGGDTGGSRPNPPSGGGSRPNPPSSGGGNSTSNGNPDVDDF